MHILKKFFFMIFLCCPIMLQPAAADPNGPGGPDEPEREEIFRDTRFTTRNSRSLLLNVLWLLNQVYALAFPERAHPLPAPEREETHAASASASAPPTVETTFYEPANPRICEIFGFRPPELPLMSDMSREDIEEYPDHRWQIRSYRAIDTIESKMRNPNRTIQQEAMEALCLTPLFPGRSHPTLFISGTLSRVDISTAIERMRGRTTSYIREFPDITPGLTYSPYHLFLMMWLHFAQGMPINVMKEWWLADPESRAMDRNGIDHASSRICINDTFTVFKALAGAPPERQDELIRHVFGHMLT